MKRKLTEIYATLPSSWKEITFKDFNKIYRMTDIDPNDSIIEMELKIEVISRLTDTPKDELLELPANDAAVLMYKIGFMNVMPERDKSFNIKVKGIDKITTESYLQFMNMADTNSNLEALVKAVTDLTDEEIDNLNMEQVWQFFFVLSKDWEKYAKRIMKRFRVREKMNKLK